MNDMHIDHIQPLRGFLRTKVADFLTALNWRNLQPLSALANSSKGSRFDEDDAREWKLLMEEDGAWIVSAEADSERESALREHNGAMSVGFVDNACDEQEDGDWYEGADSDSDEEADYDSDDYSTLQPPPVQSTTPIICAPQLPADRGSIEQALIE